MSNNNHVIGKTAIEFSQKGGHEEPFDLEKRVSRFCHDRLLPALERTFDGLASPEEYIIFDKLEITLPAITTSSDWEEVAIKKAIETLEEQIMKKRNTPDVTVRVEPRPVNFHFFDQWLHFLKKGALPGHAGNYVQKDLEKAVLGTVAGQSFAVERLKGLLTDDEKSLQRLLWQHDAGFRQQLGEAINGSKLDETYRFFAAIEKILSSVLKEEKQLLAEGIKHGTGTPSQVAESIKEFLEKTAWQVSILKNQTANLPIIWQIAMDSFFEPKVLPVLANSIRGFLNKTSLQWPDAYEVLENWATSYSVQKPTADMPILSKNETQISSPFETPERPITDANVETGPQTPTTPDGGAIEKEGFSTDVQNTDKEEGKKTVSNIADQPAAKKSRKEAEANNQMGEKLEDALVNTDEALPFRTPSDKTYWYVPCAGVILLHPFLPAFFKSLGYLNEKGDFKNNPERERAVHLLYFLATGVEHAPEHELVFSKFLCGFDLETPLKRKIHLTKKEKKESQQLLQSAIKHWSRLGNATPDVLRGSFLARPGKLSYAPVEGWLLQVEQEATDVLLNYLPWGLGVVRNRWMPGILLVEWTF